MSPSFDCVVPSWISAVSRCAFVASSFAFVPSRVSWHPGEPAVGGVQSPLHRGQAVELAADVVERIELLAHRGELAVHRVQVRERVDRRS
ncbi:MAG: hypothetical protein JO036_01980 [Candidatus Eremiobacteraeota bacterium]|nr:hypothetical protein [Candidatus Eremiobacteraeota bacterium]